jgi:hypothetical protein
VVVFVDIIFRVFSDMHEIFRNFFILQWKKRELNLRDGMNEASKYVIHIFRAESGDE